MLPLLHLPLGGVHVVVSTYALMLLVAGGAGGMLFVRRCPPALSPFRLWALLAVAALAGGRAVAMVLHDADGAGLVDGALSSTGALLAAVAAVAAMARADRVPAAALLEAVAPAALVAFGVGRLGCFLAGCCYGRPTSLPWGVVFPDLGPPARHPVQLYEAAGNLLLAALVARRVRPGSAARRAAIGYGLLRTGLELLRDPGASDRLLGGWLPVAPAAALALAAAALHPCALGGHRLWLGPSRSDPPICPTEECREWPQTRS